MDRNRAATVGFSDGTAPSFTKQGALLASGARRLVKIGGGGGAFGAPTVSPAGTDG